MLVFGAPMLGIVGYAIAELRFEAFKDDIPLDSVYKVRAPLLRNLSLPVFPRLHHRVIRSNYHSRGLLRRQRMQ